jgi:hypothetical protein
VPHCFEALQEPLSGPSPFQTTTIAQPIAGRHVPPFDGFGRLAMYAMKTRSDVDSAWARGRHGFDVRLVVIGHDFIRGDARVLDGLVKERLGTGRVSANRAGAHPPRRCPHQ